MSSKITILGDVCPSAEYSFRGGFSSALNGLVPVLQDADFAICNLECPATDGNEPIKKTGPNLKTEPEILHLLQKMGIKAVSLANNHILDYGESALLDTLNIADNIGIKHVGAGKDSVDAAKPLFVELGKKIGILAFAEHEFNIASIESPGANLFDPYVSLNHIRSTKAKCERLIVLYHGGIEHYIYPSPLLQKKCHAMVDAGADVVLFQHSHCIGTREIYKGAEILYGQGNSVFGFSKKDKSWNEGLVVQIEVTDDKLSLHYQLLEAFDDGIKLASESKTDERLKSFYDSSKAITEKKFIEMQWSAFCKKQEALYLPLLVGWHRLFNKLNRMLKGLPMRLYFLSNARQITMNLLRCDSHHEVLNTILNNTVLKK